MKHGPSRARCVLHHTFDRYNSVNVKQELLRGRGCPPRSMNALTARFQGWGIENGGVAPRAVAGGSLGAPRKTPYHLVVPANVALFSPH